MEGVAWFGTGVLLAKDSLLVGHFREAGILGRQVRIYILC